MAKYLVTSPRRVTLDGREVVPGDVLENPSNPSQLVRRGLAVPVPDTLPTSQSFGLAGLSFNDLKARARELGIPARGTRAELLVAVDAAEKAQAEAEATASTSEQAPSAAPSAEESALPDAPSEESSSPTDDASPEG